MHVCSWLLNLWTLPNASPMLNQSWYSCCISIYWGSTLCYVYTHQGTYSLPANQFVIPPDSKQSSSFSKKCIFSVMYLLVLGKNRYGYPYNRPWRPIVLWGVEVPTFSRQSAHRWRWSYQPHAPAALYPQEDSWYSVLLEAGSTRGLEGLDIH
jgi:hypothetical protein